MTLNQLKYRPDIDGLRAIAVLSVAMFHFAVGPFQGGFAGVDVFFVISGYLITGIIHKEIAAGEFTFAGFYERRVRRIFPALFAMLLVVMAMGLPILLPSDLEHLGGSVIATLLFGSNILFWRQSGYFDASSQFNPLLHTWSLSVEEQFYIGFPILLLLIERFARRQLVPVLLLLAATSFAICLYFQPLRPTAAFYLSPFRAWELIIGGLLAVNAVPRIDSRHLREVVSGAALLTLAGSLFLLEEGPNFPGWIAAFPVIATAVLLHTGASGDSLARRVLALRPLVLIGLISYSFYLWHWPIAVYANYFGGMKPLPDGAGYALLALSMLVGWASYRWVETPFRRRTARAFLGTRRDLFMAGLGSMVMLGLMGAAIRIDRGWQGRVPPAVAAMDRQRDPLIPYLECDGASIAPDRTACGGGLTNGQRIILLWGDSHALAWAPALDVLGKRLGAKVIMAPNSACPPLLDVVNPVDPACRQQNDLVRDFIRSARPDMVVIVGAWISYSTPDGGDKLEDVQGRKGNLEVFAPALLRTIAELRPHVRRIVVAGPTPGAPDEAPFLAALALRRDAAMPAGKSLEQVQERSRWFWNAARGLDVGRQVRLVDPVEWFCDRRTCRYVDRDGALLYRDGSHLSVRGAGFVAEHLTTLLLTSGGGVAPLQSRMPGPSNMLASASSNIFATR